MKNIVLLFFVFSFQFTLSAQLCTSDRFTEIPVFDYADLDGDTGLVYGHALNWQGTDQFLKLNIAYPKTSIDTMPKRPLVFLVHGGGFVSGSRNDLNLEVYQFARRGFIAVTIDYRVGLNCTAADTISQEKAIYRAIQDANAAMRYVVSIGDAIGLDTSRIFVGGSSAGAITALSMIYVSQDEIDEVFPTVSGILGNLNNSTNSLTQTFSIKGMFNNWGGITRNFLDISEAVPTISFHGDADSTVYADTAYGGSCRNPQVIYGSIALYQQMLNWGVCNQTTIKPGGGHGVYNNSSESTEFRVSKASCFFKSVMCGSCYSYYTTDSIPATCSYTLSTANNDVKKQVVYPNPFSTNIQVTNLNGDELFTLADVHGKVIYTGRNLAQYNLQSLSSGMYILRITRQGASEVYRLIKS